MKKLIIAALLALAFSPAHADFGFLKAERVSGAKRVCAYSVIQGDVVIEFPQQQACPRQIFI